MSGNVDSRKLMILVKSSNISLFYHRGGDFTTASKVHYSSAYLYYHADQFSAYIWCLQILVNLC